SSARRCRAGCQGRTRRSRAPAASDTLAPKRNARRSAARPRTLPDGENFGGGGLSFNPPSPSSVHLSARPVHAAGRSLGYGGGAGRAHCYVVGCGVDCHAMNFQPFGVFVQAARNTSFRLRGWPLISASIAARPVTSAVSPARHTLRSLQAALLYFLFPERREA